MCSRRSSKILALPRGATPVDFAYAIHSDVGDHTVAAKVNGEAVALRTELRSGDVVEIVTAPGARPNPSWLNTVRTGRARSKIRHFLKTMEQDESRALGEKMLAQALRAEGLRLPDSNPADAAAVALWQQLTRWSGNRSRADLLVDIALGRKIAGIVAKRLAQIMIDHGHRPDAVTLTLAVMPPTTTPALRAWSSSMARRAHRCRWRPVAGRSPATMSSATSAAVKGCWCTPANARSAGGCSNATASAGCRWSGPRN